MNAFRPVEPKPVHGRRDALSCPESSLFLVGKNSLGNWVVQDQSGLCGGLFVGCGEALKFALSENGNRPEAVIMVGGVLELDLTTSPRWLAPQKAGESTLQRVA